MKLLDRRFHEVAALNEKLTRERNRTRAVLWILRIVHRIKHFNRTLGIIVYDKFHRIHNSHGAKRRLIQILAYAKVKKSNIRKTVELCDAYLFTEIAYRLRRDSATAKTADRRHARIIPAVHIRTLHKLKKFALAHHCIRKIQTGKLYLLGFARSVKRLYEPVIKRTVYLKLKRAD